MDKDKTNVLARFSKTGLSLLFAEYIKQLFPSCDRN